MKYEAIPHSTHKGNTNYIIDIDLNIVFPYVNQFNWVWTLIDVADWENSLLMCTQISEADIMNGT